MKVYSADSRYAVLKEVQNCFNNKQPSPTIRELARETGIKPATVYIYMQQLADENLIYWMAHKQRSIQLVGMGEFVNAERMSAPKRRGPRGKGQIFTRKEQKLKGAGRKAYEAECFMRAVELGLKNDQASREDVMYERHGVLSRGLGACKVG